PGPPPTGRHTDRTIPPAAGPLDAVVPSWVDLQISSCPNRSLISSRSNLAQKIVVGRAPVELVVQDEELGSRPGREGGELGRRSVRSLVIPLPPRSASLEALDGIDLVHQHVAPVARSDDALTRP